MMNASCIISFHKAKFSPSNFWISTLVQDVEAISFFENEIFTKLVFFFSFFVAFVAIEQVSPIPLDGEKEKEREIY